MRKSYFTSLLVTLTSTLLVIQSSSAGDLMDHWTWSHPLPTGETLSSVAHGNGTWVAVGDQTILRSPDGITWAHAAGETNASLTSVVFGGGQFVAVGAKAILTSPDGQNWTPRAGNSQLGGWSIAYGAGRYVATTSEGYTLRSSNGVDWVAASTGGAFYSSAVAFGQGLFVAVCCSGRIFTSPDGQAWTPRNSGTTQQLLGITFGNGTFVTTGDGVILTSPDGIVWTPRNAGVSAQFYAPAYANGKFVVVAGSYPTSILLHSTDGITWNPASSYSASLRVGDLRGFGGGNGWFVGVGSAGTIATSIDGDQWIDRNPESQDILDTVTYGNGLFVAVGQRYDRSGAILTSPDGITWTERNSGVTGVLSGVTYALGRFISVGFTNDGQSTGSLLTSSTDGTNWTAANSGTFSALRSVASGNGLVLSSSSYYIPDSQSFVWRVVGSTNGTDWSEDWSQMVDGSEGYLGTITFGQGLFLLGGSAGIWSSTDGRHWTQRYAPNQVENIWTMTYGNGRFVVGGDVMGDGPALLLTSTNGIAWKNVAFAGPGVDMPDRILGASSGGGLLVLVASKFLNYPGGESIFTSVDGVQWTWHGYINQQVFGGGIAYGAGRFVVAADSGLMSCDVRPQLGPISMSPSGVAGSSVLGVSGLRYDVQASTDLVDWIAVTNVLAPNGTAPFIDPAAAGKGQRFYRATPRIGP